MKRIILLLITIIINVFALTACKKHEHEPSDWIIVRESSCIDEGIQQIICNDCGEILNEEKKDKLPHDYENGKCKYCDEYQSTKELQYKLSEDGKSYIVTGIDARFTGNEVIIPKRYNNLLVTGIDSWAFSNFTRLKTIVIPDSITSVGSDAFQGCENLKYNIYDNAKYLGNNENPYLILVRKKSNTITSCEINENTKIILEYAFFNCYKLTDIVIPDSVTSIGECAFFECSSLTNIELSDSITCIENRTFYKCKSLTSIIIPNGVTSIGNDAFGICTSLTSVTIPNSVTSIGTNAFYDCKSLTSITIPNGVTSIGNDAFKSCSNLEYNIYDNAKYIGNDENPYLFLVDVTDDYITSCKINNSTKFIGDEAFSNCKSLTSIELGNSVTSINDEAFLNCVNLENVYYAGTIEDWSNISFSKFDSNPMYYAKNFYMKDTNNEYCEVKEINLPNITTINNYQLCGFDNITTIVIPNSVTSIGNYAFSGCSSLNSIEIPDSVTSIGERAFYGCDSLTSIEIPDSVTSIGDYAFYDCSSLINIKIPKSVTTINVGLFDKCSSLTSIEIPNSIKSIGDYAFYGCSSLTSIEIPDSVTKIGSEVFYECSSLEFNIFDNAKYLGNVQNPYLYLIESLDKDITSCNIHHNTKLIAELAFEECAGLSSIVIPNSVTIICNAAFAGCDNLIFYFESTVLQAGWYMAFDYLNKEMYLGNQWEYDSNGNPAPVNK